MLEQLHVNEFWILLHVPPFLQGVLLHEFISAKTEDVSVPQFI
jgi:hypothetical protein